jgi:hypothetical protein
MDNKEYSCCSPNALREKVSEEGKTNEPTELKGEISAKFKEQNKLLVDIYVPLEACACEWSQFMNLIFSTITPYIKHIKHDTKSLNSEEARKLNLHSKCVIIDGKKKYTTSYALKKDLPILLKEKGLI